MNLAAYAALAAVLFLNQGFHLPAFLQKKPPTAQLAAAQADLAKARAGQQQAEAELAAARAAQAARLAEQLDYTQQMVTGTDLALRQIPGAHQSPELKLAAEFSARAVAGFEAARGKLTPQQRAEIEGLFTAALAAKDAEVTTLRASLAQKDSDLQASTSAKAALEKKIPVLEASVTTAQAATAVESAKVETKTREVVTYADKAATEKARAGSLDAYAGNLVRILIGLGLLYALVHFALPNLAQEFPAAAWLGKANKFAKSISSSHL